jgi:tetratricopeptide (TPR) repeat protein
MYRFLVVLGACCAFAQTPEQNAQALLNHAMQAQQAGQLDEAVASYRTLLAKYPNIAEIRSNLGAALAAQGKYEEAAQEYKRSLAVKPNPQVRVNLGLAHYKSGDIVAATNTFRAAHAELPDNLQVVTLLSDCYLRSGRNQDVIDLLTPIQQAHPDEPAFQYLLGTALVRHGDAAKGQVIIDQILRRGESAEAHLLMGTTRYAANEFAEAREEFKKSAALNPELPDVFAYLGLALLATGDQAGARTAFERELASNPNNFESNLHLAAILRNDDQPDAALQRLQRALQVRPDDPGARYQVASIEISKGQLSKAQSNLESLIAAQPDFIEAHVSLATVYFRQKRKADGDKEREIVAKLTAERQKVNEIGAKAATNEPAQDHAALGRKALDDKDYPRAVSELAVAAKAEPKAPEVQSMYGRALLMTGDPDAAESAFRAAVESNPDDRSANLGLAQVAIARRQFAAALPLARHALELQPDNTQAKMCLAEALVGNGHVSDARPYAEQAVAQLPDSEQAHRTLSQVYTSLHEAGKAAAESKKADQLAEQADPGPSRDEPAPDFALPDAATGKVVRLSSFHGKSPVAIIFGSYSCPNFRASADALKSMQQRYGRRVPFLLVYVREAHATGQWQSTRNLREDVALAPAATMTEKEEHAAMCSRKLHLPFPALVDGMDGAVEAAYNAWPSRAYLLSKEGTIVYSTRLDELEFQPARMEAALRRLTTTN